MICSNCGADISSKDIKCPYCGAMQYEASEKKYMNDLYKINSDMDNLDKNVRRYALLSIAKSIGYVLIGTAAALVIGVAIGRLIISSITIQEKNVMRFIKLWIGTMTILLNLMNCIHFKDIQKPEI